MGLKVLEMSTIHLDKNDDFVLTVIFLPSLVGNYPIAVEAIRSLHYRERFTNTQILPSSIENLVSP